MAGLRRSPDKPVCAEKFPGNREITGNISPNWPANASIVPISLKRTACWRQIPYLYEQGICFRGTGNEFRETGKVEAATGTYSERRTACVLASAPPIRSASARRPRPTLSPRRRPDGASGSKLRSVIAYPLCWLSVWTSKSSLRAAPSQSRPVASSWAEKPESSTGMEAPTYAGRLEPGQRESRGDARHSGRPRRG